MGEFSRAYANKTQVHVKSHTLSGYTANDRLAIAHGFVDYAGNAVAPAHVWVAERPADPYLSQTLTITGTPTGGDFTISYDGQTTAAIAYNAAAAAVESALEALSNLTPSQVACTGGALPGTAVVIALSGVDDPALMTANGAGLTGGTSPAADIAVTSLSLTHNNIGIVDWDDTYVYVRCSQTSGSFDLCMV